MAAPPAQRGAVDPATFLTTEAASSVNLRFARYEVGLPHLQSGFDAQTTLVDAAQGRLERASAAQVAATNTLLQEQRPRVGGNQDVQGLNRLNRAITQLKGRDAELSRNKDALQEALQRKLNCGKRIESFRTGAYGPPDQQPLNVGQHYESRNILGLGPRMKIFKRRKRQQYFWRLWGKTADFYLYDVDQQHGLGSQELQNVCKNILHYIRIHLLCPSCGLTYDESEYANMTKMAMELVHADSADPQEHVWKHPERAYLAESLQTWLTPTDPASERVSAAQATVRQVLDDAYAELPLGWDDVANAVQGQGVDPPERSLPQAVPDDMFASWVDMPEGMQIRCAIEWPLFAEWDGPDGAQVSKACCMPMREPWIRSKTGVHDERDGPPGCTVLGDQFNPKYGYIILGADKAKNRKGAHELVCSMFWGPRPGEPGVWHAAHTCGNANCLNPLHLQWMTNSQNQLCRAWHAQQALQVHAGARQAWDVPVYQVPV